MGQEDLMEEEISTHSNILVWEVPWTEYPGGLQSMGSQRVRHNLPTEQTCKEIRWLISEEPRAPRRVSREALLKASWWGWGAPGNHAQFSDSLMRKQQGGVTGVNFLSP